MTLHKSDSKESKTIKKEKIKRNKEQESWKEKTKKR